MTDINLIRDLNAFKKMYSYIFNAVTDAINICKDSEVKNMLIQAQQHTEALYSGENCNKNISVDDETIVDLLKLLIKTETDKPVSQQDTEFIDECKDWILDLQNARIDDCVLDECISE